MKWNTSFASIAFVGLFSVCSSSAEPDLQARLDNVAKATGKDYVDLRDTLVVRLSTNSLMEAVDNGTLEWRERLVARIVLERKLRGADILRLRRYEWMSDREFDPRWPQMLSGVAGHMTPLAVRRFEQSGLWYYYIEQNWKNTGEIAIPSQVKRMDEAWPFYASGAVLVAREAWYLRRVQADFIRQEGTARGKAYFRRLYAGLLKGAGSDAVPSLLNAFDDYFVSSVGKDGFEAFPGSRDITYRSMFNLMLDIADARHADLLDTFISARPALLPLRTKLSEVRERQAPAPVPEPPFRLMSTPEFLRTGPLVPERAPD